MCIYDVSVRHISEKYPADDYVHRNMCKLFKHNDYCQLYDREIGEYLR